MEEFYHSGRVRPCALRVLHIPDLSFIYNYRFPKLSGGRQ